MRLLPPVPACNCMIVPAIWVTHLLESLRIVEFFDMERVQKKKGGKGRRLANLPVDAPLVDC